MKKFLKIFALLLAIPLCFSIGGCKDKDKGKGSGSGGSKQEQPVKPEEPETPETPEQPENPEDPENPENPEQPEDPETPENPEQPEEPEVPEEPEEPVIPEPQHFKVNFDYNLPEDYDHLLSDKSVEKEVSEKVELLTVGDAKLNEYFLGWYDKKTNTLISTAISGTPDLVKDVVGKWNVTDLTKYYYTDGLTFGVGEDTQSNEAASVTSYTGSQTKVILPVYYEVEEGREIPVRIIAENAFKNSNVTEIVQKIEGLVIERNAFENSKLKSFDFSKTYVIGESAFVGAKLESVELSAFVSSLGEYAFSNNANLVSADISKVGSLTNVPAGLFKNSAKLSQVKIANSMTKISSYAFSGCEAIKNLNFLTANVTSIETRAFENCLGIKEVNLAKTITNIGYSVFSGCLNIEKLVMGCLKYENSIDTFSTYMGDLSASLKILEITDDEVLAIPENYFVAYANLVSVVIPNQVTTIGEYAFSGCVKLAEITFPDELNLLEFNLNSVNETAWYLNLNNVVYIKNVLFYVPKTHSGVVEIKAGTTTIFEKAFYQNTGVTTIKIPSSVSSIGEYAFSECKALTTIIFEENSVLTEIKAYTFNRSSKLSSINLNACINIESIKRFAFGYVEDIETFVLPQSLEMIAEQAFFRATIAGFDIADTALNFAVEDGIVYNKQKTALCVYPSGKTDKAFFMPSTVTQVLNYAVAYNDNLCSIYITSSELSCTSKSFYNLGGDDGLSLYIEDPDITYGYYNADVYYLLDGSNFTYEFDDDYVISINEDAEIESGAYFVVINDGSADNFYILIVDVSGETVIIEEQINVTDRLI